MKPVLIAASLLACLIFAGACQKRNAPTPAAGPRKLVVVTTLFPLYDFVRAIGGDKVDVRLLLPPGVEAHSFEPKPEDALRTAKADLFVFTNPYMEPWAVSFVKGLDSGTVTLVDASTGVTFLKAGLDAEQEEHGHEGDHHAGGMDPHIWLDFGNARIMVANIAAGMVAKDPANAGYYRANAGAYTAELKKLDADYRAGLSSCGKKAFLHGGHYAFGYLANRYGLRYESASAVNADAEPTPARLMALVKQVRATGLKYVFSEELLSPRVSEVIARENGVSVLLLHGAHNISKSDFEHGVTFLALMRSNLANLRTGLECR
ncbi:zinc ABC transporter substrate-binding protein [Geobacter sp. FeAm09]|uniref:metal ABC transporter substrate-binding protein n=1 Tax=Geobacter sp. FeAm09 TaxID=2597769 RepID=UPI0011EF6B0A|nr:metal ABC transporter substrate-binding protein [Geobacter sp. FeAm09]QEM68636.1 zinc ABC transporter substrate-binding protein [Geobacter sp. FeAm09]